MFRGHDHFIVQVLVSPDQMCPTVTHVWNRGCSSLPAFPHITCHVKGGVVWKGEMVRRKRPTSPILPGESFLKNPNILLSLSDIIFLHLKT